MNLREGTRRLALLLGVAGAIVGGFASYMELQIVSAQTTAHKQFEQLANSGIVQQQRKALQSPPDYDALAKKYGGTVVQPQSAHPPIDLSAGLDAPPDSTPPGDKVKLDWSTSVPIPSIVMEGGIRTINWSHDYGVQSIETEDGQTLYPTPSPGGWSYFVIVILPMLGFLIPWGAIRAIGWVGAGFVQTVSHT